MARSKSDEKRQVIQVTLYGDEPDAIAAEAERTGTTRQRVLADYAIAYLRHLTAERQAEAVGSPLLDRLEMLERTMAAEHDAMLADLAATHAVVVQLSDFMDLAVQTMLMRMPQVPSDAMAGARAASAESYASILDAMLRKKGRLDEVLARRALTKEMADA
ncbi:hypothetical protein [Acidithiobacillus sp.]|uniref:hypothetical protein n=1 Tax=Acidithiobacillus sp. TaxID=1872118 RepID=UPI003CFFC2B3